jgi:hypothetical protein
MRALKAWTAARTLSVSVKGISGKDYSSGAASFESDDKGALAALVFLHQCFASLIFRRRRRNYCLEHQFLNETPGKNDCRFVAGGSRQWRVATQPGGSRADL